MGRAPTKDVWLKMCEIVPLHMFEISEGMNMPLQVVMLTMTVDLAGWGIAHCPSSLAK
jgi:hypothetical protein